MSSKIGVSSGNSRNCYELDKKGENILLTTKNFSSPLITALLATVKTDVVGVCAAEKGFSAKLLRSCVLPLPRLPKTLARTIVRML